ncbi:B-cell antigen receptor complex-associated protein alpha chain [Nerophis lumbriciformis]|uniref:B-cell antigen receptor complex-associated protein alpha chain n=1 Tax=Nerophis lumbriciformis TaxID=546530 RepID=UPI002ADF8A9C|nr:B-cell antigen receptor complex-associated protein alpha chain-like isoform X1 [Nerophis lumbriciformis]
MTTIHVFIICSLAVVFAAGKVSIEADRPWLRVRLFHTAVLECCFGTDQDSVRTAWIKEDAASGPNPVVASDMVTAGHRIYRGVTCGTLMLTKARLSDGGLYRCRLNATDVITHGTYLQVYEPLKKTINLSEKTKNNILMAEGLLLFLCVLVPSVALLFKSKQLSALQKTKARREEENIYQGLNLEECCAIYDQIDHSKTAVGPYQDVLNNVEEEIQLENP